MSGALSRRRVLRIDSVVPAAYALWRTLTRTRAIAADASFHEAVKSLTQRFRCEAVLKSDGYHRHVYSCRRCNLYPVQVTVCERPVLKQSTIGVRVGTLSYVVPSCPDCKDAVPLNVSGAVFVDRGLRIDGYRGVSTATHEFLNMQYSAQ
jgi:hypothetical protein